MGANVSCACVVIFCDGIGTRDAHLNKLVALTSAQEIDFDFRQNDIVLVLVVIIYCEVCRNYCIEIHPCYDYSAVNFHRHGPSEECFLQHVVLRENGC